MSSEIALSKVNKELAASKAEIVELNEVVELQAAEMAQIKSALQLAQTSLQAERESSAELYSKHGELQAKQEFAESEVARLREEINGRSGQLASLKQVEEQLEVVCDKLSLCESRLSASSASESVLRRQCAAQDQTITVLKSDMESLTLNLNEKEASLAELSRANSELLHNFQREECLNSRLRASNSSSSQRVQQLETAHQSSVDHTVKLRDALIKIDSELKASKANEALLSEQLLKSDERYLVAEDRISQLLAASSKVSQETAAIIELNERFNNQIASLSKQLTASHEKCSLLEEQVAQSKARQQQLVSAADSKASSLGFYFLGFGFGDRIIFLLLFCFLYFIFFV